MTDPLYVWTSGDTVTTLAETIGSEGCFCSLIEIHGKLESDNSIKKQYYLCTDFTPDVFVKNLKLPVLRQLKINSKGFVINELRYPIWLKVTRRMISKIRLYICDDVGNIMSFKGKGLSCTLLFSRSQERYGFC